MERRSAGHGSARGRLVAAALAALGGLAGGAPAATAASTLTVADAVDRPCHDRLAPSAPGHASHDFTAADAGAVTARLTGDDGDWDVAVFARGGRLVAASSSFGSSEVAAGYVGAGEALTVQACRRSGDGERARLELDNDAIEGATERASLVRVSTPTRARKRELNSLGLDLTEHGRRNFVEVVLHGEEDAETLREHEFVYTTEIRDLAAQNAKDRAADRRYDARVRASALPSGRTTYRRLADYSEDMKRLADQNPNLVRPFTLPEKTYEGRTVEGIEITENVNARDGKPVFLQLGVHHAREWPSSEHAIEWAFELVNGYKSNNSRARDLVRSTRTIVVPIVNPDGFNASREAGEAQGAGNGRGAPPETDPRDAETANIVSHPNEYRRKNCRFVDDSNGGSCAQPSGGLAEPGVDPNRNYGAFWGGPGASNSRESQTYRGPGPFSEPETRNVRSLISGRQVVALITNHTYSNLVLRPPGLSSQGLAPDEELLKQLGDSMAAENGYTSQYGWQLYDTSGTTEDWSYSVTGGLGYTFEIGPFHFHPPYQDVVNEWEGTTAAADKDGRDGKGNREAYYKAQEATANAANHSVINGRAPAGSVLRVQKTFNTRTSKVLQDDGSEGPRQEFPDHLESTMMPSTRTGLFNWHVNPSTRPVVMRDIGRPATGNPSSAQSFSGTPGPPLVGPAGPCANFDNPPSWCYRDHVVNVASGPGIDNAKAVVRIEWPTPGSDWDMKVFRGDGSGNAMGGPIATSGQGTTDFEQATIGDPSGQYIVRVQNWAAAEPYDGTVTFQGPEPFEPAQTESWTLTCERPEGRVLERRDVTVARGQAVTERLDCGRELAITGSARIASNGRTAVKARCLSARTCRGVMRLYERRRSKKGSAAARRGRRVGKRRYKIRANRTRKIRIRVSRRGRNNKRLIATATIRPKLQAPNRNRASKTLRIKRSRR